LSVSLNCPCLLPIRYSLTSIYDYSTTEFMASVPGAMTIEVLTDDNGRVNVSRVYARWKPDKEQSGDNILCVWGMKHNG